MSRPIQVVGAGGHGKVLVATVVALGFDPVIVHDDREDLWGTHLLGHPVVGPVAAVKAADGPVVLGVGSNEVRARIADRLSVDWATAVHPAAVVHESVSVGEGSVVFAGAVVQPEAVLGAHVIINTSASVDHDCVVGSFVHLAPGTHLSGGVRVGDGTLIGVGASVIPGVEIGEWAVIGAGACCTRQIPPRSLAVGVPARVRRLLAPGAS